MSETVQPGAEIDAALWKRFRQDVQARKGAVRGHLRTELENAIRQYLDGGEPQSFGTVDERLSRIEAAVGATSADGGTDTLTPAGHTHAPDTKPPANAPTEKKLAYLAKCVLDREVPNSRELASIPRTRLIEVVKDEYGFRADTAKRYVSQLADSFNLREHPQADDVLVTESRYTELVETEAEAVERRLEE